MAYFIDETIPSNTTKTSPLVYNLEITPLRIDKIDIVFPDGCVYLCGVRIKYRSLQIFPYNDRKWFIGNGNTISFTTEYECIEPPYVIQFEYFNEDEVYQHRPIITLDVSFIKEKQQSMAQTLVDSVILRKVQGRR